jgi:hypothetical protein
MKLICLLVLFLILPGCVSTFDSFEYRGFVKVAALADKADCSQENIAQMIDEARFLYRYSLHKPHEQVIADGVNELLDSILEVKSRYNTDTPPSLRYCQLKMNGIAILAGTFANTIGYKSR